jgi:hypothetical protein
MYERKIKVLLLSSVLLFVALVLAFSQPVEALNEEIIEIDDAMIPGIEVQRLKLTSGPVSIDSEYFSQNIQLSSSLSEAYMTVYEITSDKQGWVVFHEDVDGEPGKVIGKIQVGKGVTLYAQVETMEQARTEPIHAMLHIDQAAMGRLDFPYGPDIPVYEQGQLVNVQVPPIVD